MCKDDHFNHQAEEVWRALFGNRNKSKGFFNYSLLSMVYAELKLERKVDWSTFPMTVQYSLRIGKIQKDVPDIESGINNDQKDVGLFEQETAKV
jgi:hypothetical protein